MDEKLIKIANAFNPNVQAESRYYINCHKARGDDDGLAENIKNMLRSAHESHDKFKFLFTGHVGCGKSSELVHLTHILERDTSFFPVYIDFEKYLDKRDVTLEDIFLGMIAEIAQRCRNKFELKTKAESYSLLKKISSVVSDFSVKGEVGLPFDLAKFNVERLTKNPSLREQVREAIQDDPKKSLFSELNDFITEIELRLRQNEKGFANLILIADSLEKIDKFDGKKERLPSQQALFLDQAEKLTGIVAHILYTVPLSLYRSNYGPQLPALYGINVAVLPMVKIHQRGKFTAPYETGIEELKKIITKRLRPAGVSLEEAFTDDALQHIITYSGGNIRSLIRFIQGASFAVDELPIDFKAARQSVRKEVRTFAASVPESYWEKLARLELSPRQQIVNDDDDYAKMLESTAILEYVNGDDSNNNDEVEDADDDCWYAVNPAIRRTIKFNDALDRLKAALII